MMGTNILELGAWQEAVGELKRFDRKGGIFRLILDNYAHKEKTEKVPEGPRRC